uniref:RNA polymerase-associated protein CTR9 n=1 Tax=Aceria tosichella TaxID=561515 RepID=A0A6G1S7A9_9ACAR
MATQQIRKIEIPFKDNDQFAEIDVSNLPDPLVMVHLLTDQDCTIDLWISVALEYYRQDKQDGFELILTSCLTQWDLNKVKHEDPSNPKSENRIKALDLLAVYYVRRAKQAKNREAKRDLSTKATQKLTEVDKTGLTTQRGEKASVHHVYHLLARAYHFLMTDGRYEQADYSLNYVLTEQPDNVASLLGKAIIEFNKKEPSGKRNALGFYKKALQICPNCPADVRLGLGICFYKLNMFDKAEAAFKRALALDPKCVGALTGLAVIELNKKLIDSIKRGIEYLSRAFKIEPTNSMVLTLLADHFFYANEHEKVIKLANRALENTENEAMQAQACYQLGRAYHRRKEYNNAFEYYYKATQFGGSQAFLAYYGLGQMYIHRGEYEAAIQAFETVLSTNPNSNETLKVLATLYARGNSQTKKDQAKTYLEKVTTNCPDDVESWFELASLCEQHDTQTALNAYRKCIALYEAQSKPAPAELYNNIAALLFSINSLEESEHNYNLAKQRCFEEEPNNPSHYESIRYTIEYNVGRLYEAKHELQKAEATYKKILIDHPMYIDCYLRLGCMDRDKGELFDASDKFKETLRTEPYNFEAWTLLGNLHFSKLELTPCQKKFELILKKTPANPDGYSLIQVGNVWLQSQYMQVKDREKLTLQRGRALSFYKAALQHDPKNIYAANGLGCIFAIKGMYNEARDIFSQVREATADFPDVWINIAHIYVEQKQFAAAVQMYENCLKKFYNNSNTEILLYMARALFKSNKLLECKKVLLRARYICPYDLVILFNLAKLLKTLARQVFEDRKSTYQQVITAEYELKLAKSYFHTYTELKDKTRSENDKSLIDLIIVELEERDCADLLLQVETTIKIEAERRDREENQRRKEHEEQLRLELARKAEEEERRLKDEQQKKEELENKRKELLKRQEEARQKMLEEKQTSIINDDESDEGSRRKKQKTKKKEKTEKDRDRKRHDKERPADRDNKKFKSRPLLSSDSSSTSSGDEGVL